ncbi:Uaf30p KNAG_0G03040 [Huiozyma naganishii CBS 8797]|uniref:DM2 domain-containing protein n=1 Tax=Huiozyma naganishii (strain ATCC MYA-139 / BCRC 22969 / CBS 8797 / KCTC 17520 / NBRC 10181 / NCYC 3082 / Yp74L-3) TaxID=1071383 RepID=J7S979_HUIN7|nr:hypothetical protein KNAG_0G03040 [Kazachstania naganishii CBS 8797]CCK71361.1 hypothetical protein KNAG_0G03040 [Kazachstania naganishii CBS 8797]
MSERVQYDVELCDGNSVPESELPAGGKDFREFVPMVDAVLQSNVDSPAEQVDFEQVKTQLEEVFVYNLDPYRKELFSIIEQRLQLLRDSEIDDTTAADSFNVRQAFLGKVTRENIENKIHKPSKKSRKIKSRRSRHNELGKFLRDHLGVEQIESGIVEDRVRDYVNRSNLRNATNSDEIICDARMQPLFGERITESGLNAELKQFVSQMKQRLDHPVGANASLMSIELFSSSQEDNHIMDSENDTSTPSSAASDTSASETEDPAWPTAPASEDREDTVVLTVRGDRSSGSPHSDLDSASESD